MLHFARIVFCILAILSMFSNICHTKNVLQCNKGPQESSFITKFLAYQVKLGQQINVEK